MVWLSMHTYLRGNVMNTISREEYDRKVPHGYAGPGRPSDPSLPGVWWIEGPGVLVFGEVLGSGPTAAFFDRVGYGDWWAAL